MISTNFSLTVNHKVISFNGSSVGISAEKKYMQKAFKQCCQSSENFPRKGEIIRLCKQAQGASTST